MRIKSLTLAALLTICAGTCVPAFAAPAHGLGTKLDLTRSVCDPRTCDPLPPLGRVPETSNAGRPG